MLRAKSKALLCINPLCEKHRGSSLGKRGSFFVACVWGGRGIFYKKINISREVVVAMANNFIFIKIKLFAKAKAMVAGDEGASGGVGVVGEGVVAVG